MDFTIGQIVFSKAGRDKGNAFVITDVEGEYLYLVDGYGRPLERPKRKKSKHVQPTWTVVRDLHEAIKTKQHMKNADFRSALKKYQREWEEISHG
ncbi:MAG: KOW domain-containing RNA-binding protein [Defluviitaleaceae bacterium]|nr:KOW domain-containing RNA-binding protein [Defluviitaleaceae bacterium]